MITKQRRHQSKKLRDSAKGQDCLIRSPVCNFNPETTVLCHMNGGGTGTKKSDIFGAFGCSDCHDLCDSRGHKGYSPAAVELWHYGGNQRTIQWWLDHEYIKL